jgi:dephospho-CoA kinase
VAERHSEAAPRILGLTGPIACGKTAVGTMLLRIGAAARIDADEVVHELMQPNTETTRRIEHAFGDAVIASNGAVDRRVLGKRVFSDPAALLELERIVHPAVRPAIQRKLEDLAGDKGIVVLDAVKLLQSDLADLCTAIWAVHCGRDQELRRLIDDRAMSEEDAWSRLAAQPAFDDPRVSVVIDNSGTREETLAQVRREWEELTRQASA